MDSVLARLENLQGRAEGRLLDSLEASDTTAATQPYLPGTSFKKVSGTSLSTGLVIEDTSVAGNGNQFVWVEVPNDGTGPYYSDVENEEDYEEIGYALQDYALNYRGVGCSGYGDIYHEGCGLADSSTYTTLYQTMLASIYTHGGFWIGRYETGILQTDTNGPRTASAATTTPQQAVITKDAYPYNYVTCSQAQSLASNINSGDSRSSLMFGIQWDLVLRYLVEKGATPEELKNTTTGSTSWGNYIDASVPITSNKALYCYYDEVADDIVWSTDLRDRTGEVENKTKLNAESILLTTGANEARNSKQNICDLAGNVEEWTLEYSQNYYDPCITRGGSYRNDGCSGAADEYWSNHSFLDGVGFRVSLY